MPEEFSPTRKTKWLSSKGRQKSSPLAVRDIYNKVPFRRGRTSEPCLICQCERGTKLTEGTWGSGEKGDFQLWAESYF